MPTVCVLRDQNKNDLNAKPSFQIIDSAEIPNKWNKSTVTYCIMTPSKHMSLQLQREIINLAWEVWKEEMGLNLVEVKATQNL